MKTVFWDWKGILLIKFLVRGTTINSASYCDTMDELRLRIERKRPGLLTKGVLLFHDNAKPHMSRVTKAHLSKFKWEFFRHPPYSPNLAPSVYHILPLLKTFSGGKHFSNDLEIREAVKKFFAIRTRQYNMLLEYKN